MKRKFKQYFSVNNSFNISKANNHILPQTSEHKKYYGRTPSLVRPQIFVSYIYMNSILFDRPSALKDHIVPEKKGCLWTQILIFLGFKIHKNNWLTQYLIMKSRMFWNLFDFLSHLKPARYKCNDRYSIASAKLSLQNKKTELWQINPYFSD